MRIFLSLNKCVLLTLTLIALCVYNAYAAPPQIIGDGIPVALTGMKGDAIRGRAIVANRQLGLCTLCHQLADVASTNGEKFQGNLSINLTGVGARLSEAQLRLRIVDNRRVNVKSIMPAFYNVNSLTRVGASWQGQTILTAQQIEDVVAYLVTLK
jgi:L-cysteine S-thiosulfotransferase